MGAAYGVMGSAECILGVADKLDTMAFSSVNEGWPVWALLRNNGVDAVLLVFDEYDEIAVIYGRRPPPPSDGRETRGTDEYDARP